MKKRPEFVSIGIIIKAHGIKGEIVVLPTTDNVQQFKQLKIISVEFKNGEREFFPIERVNAKTNRIILKLEKIKDRDDALTLKGLNVDKHIQDCQELPPDEYYIFDIVGLRVKTTSDTWLGEVTDVLTLPANDIYVVEDDSNQFLIPAIKDVIKKVDLEEEYILIEPLDGLLQAQ